MVTSYLQKLRLFNRDVWLYLVAGAAVGASLFGILGVLRNLYMVRLGYGPDFVGLTTAAGSIAWAAVALPVGAMGRRWSVRRTMVAGLGVVSLATILLTCSESLPMAWRRGWIIASSVLSTAGMTLYMVNAYPSLTAATGEAERPYAFSMWLAILPLSGFGGALVAGRLPGLIARMLEVPVDGPETFGYSLWAGSALFIPGALALLATQRSPRVISGSTERSAGPAPFAVISVVAVVALLGKAAMATYQNFFNMYLDADLRLPTARIGTLMALAQLVSAVTVLAAPLLMARFGKHGTYALACVGMVAGLLLLGLVPQWIAAGIGYALLSTMTFVADAGFNVASQEAVAPGWRSTVSGASFMAEGVSRTLVGIIGGLAIVVYGYRPLFGVVSVLAAAAGLVFWICFRRPRGEAAQGA